MSLLPPVPSRDELLARHGDRYKWLVLLVVGVGMIAAVLCTTSFNVAVPTLGRQFGLGQNQVQWTITGFMAAMTVAMLPSPWLLDRFGFRRVFLTAVALLATGSVAGALSTGFGFVVTARIVQGAAAGLLQPLAMLAVMRLFPPHSQGRASGLLSFGIVLAPAVAPSLAGALLDGFGWEAIFLMNLPFCAVAGVLGLRLLPRPAELRASRFDWFGVALLAGVALATIEAVASLGRNGFASAGTLALFAMVAVCGGLYASHARRAAAPVVPLDLFRERSFAMGALVSFAYGFGLYASTYVIPVFLQHAIGFDATAAGFALLPAGIALVIVIPIAGLLTDRLPPRTLTVAGLALFGISFVLFAALAGRLHYLGIVLVTVLGRVGLGLVIPALNLATLRYLRPEQLGRSSMVTSYLRQLGGVVGVAVIAVFVEWREAGYGAAPGGVLNAYSEAFWLLAAAFAFALVAALRMKPRTEA
ncbi:MAG: DHA2 family efflux MFS transporter permease subunit [Aromatoleum sp.]|jgi:EmrB/QacA subfamily drug resistance transporter|uniref:DHA2 family efflux MFS transporter permease subunit n=1 Tax=Aromatoleum sp. TaxID=2307007 RepID=UPI00289390B9|nr:DHA2 family efflux MFS transporter permease subunit [Aromatoleum sp.]MDT3672716.1 DHA2 family efflux MFS transporter permease subunit [Aromatoleum sp.]